ncbi:nuclear transport factor 2 family protein [Chroococcidiopsis sp. CCNUC1]|uniref:nuclear transport factor 2 family protein n=1 Tax=Chroococcidiopsis sp. CCNUC1 TaxID=2653189 RepID=UPI0020224D17|nr:nuclear transport factor 2 family protein [Chroococcidiopsis sp. CCNUC1]URD53561.1 YciI family protein [Chroococcidiopsis sp. CCNUC1]
MRFMLLMIPKGYESAAPGAMPDPKAVETMMKYNESLQQAGLLIALEGLHPPSMGARITFNQGNPKVTQGISSDVEEVLGGYWIIQANSKQEAIEWASRCPASDNETIEIRQVQEFDDFPADIQQVVDQFPEMPHSYPTTAENTQTTNEAQIRQLIADQQRAICTKDVDWIMSRYANEVILFDVKPPFQTKGKDAVRQLWQDCLPYFPDAFEMETRDLTIAVNDDLAVAHWLFRFQGEQNHPAMQTWMRATAVCQKERGNWQILHEHISVPFHPETSQAAFTLNP